MYFTRVNSMKNGPDNINRNIRVFRCDTRILSRELFRIFVWVSTGYFSKISSAISLFSSQSSGSFSISSFKFCMRDFGSYRSVCYLAELQPLLPYILRPIMDLSMFWKTLSFKLMIKCLRVNMSLWFISNLPLESMEK